MSHETLAGVSFEVLEDIRHEKAESRVYDGRVAIEAAHYVSMGAELFGNPVFNVGDETRFLESPVQFVLNSLAEQYPTRTAAPKLALQLGTAIARGEGRMASANYLDLIERCMDSPSEGPAEYTERQIQQVYLDHCD